MTRSVEIPEAAVEAAARALFEDQDGCFVQDENPWLTTFEQSQRPKYIRRATRALEAALPYLAPAEQPAPNFIDEKMQKRLDFYAASAGDGGLRDALEAVLDQHECTQPDTPKFNRAVLDDLLAAVAAHPVVDSTELKEKTMSGTKETSAAPTRLANRNGLRVGELIEFLQTQDPDAPVAAGCGCGPSGWSAPATDAHADSSTAVNVGACVKIGWGDFE